jgi:GDP/UDP-N,N'-diacetylbacillosamine 2-epimerase (hydrolysing)
MLGAVMSSIPFNIPIAHIHGGETTLGAIDNIFRHCISLSSKWHFVSTNRFISRVKGLIGNSESKVYNVGALSLDSIGTIKLLSRKQLSTKHGFDFTAPFILTTFHPETKNLGEIELHLNEISQAIEELETYNFIITMPNADTSGSKVRMRWHSLKEKLSDRILLVENFGTQGYFSSMKYCSFILGNSSSGIIEAASFSKYVINLGDRQKGRVHGHNVITLPVSCREIVTTVERLAKKTKPVFRNIYYNGGAAKKIMEILKQEIK